MLSTHFTTELHTSLFPLSSLNEVGDIHLNEAGSALFKGLPEALPKLETCFWVSVTAIMTLSENLY